MTFLRYDQIMRKRRYLFLDIYGVLNTHSFLSALFQSRKDSACDPKDEDMIDPFHVQQLNLIVSETGCEVILSSAWRVDGAGKVLLNLRAKGFAHRLAGSTPHPKLSCSRGQEIQRWIDENGGLESMTICIVDDDRAMGDLSKFHVWCDPSTGLTASRAALAIDMLNGDK